MPCEWVMRAPVKNPGDLNKKSRQPQGFEPHASIGSRIFAAPGSRLRRIEMAELTIPFARRSGAEGTAHLIAGLMARCAGRAFGGFAKAAGEGVGLLEIGVGMHPA